MKKHPQVFFIASLFALIIGTILVLLAVFGPLDWPPILRNSLSSAGLIFDLSAFGVMWRLDML
ncbi:hypothetical protein [Lacticaseibacillus brantae]|uniref:Uncharacterized protein n=1 Tax=Lacticaseibacillus brantae DSM 23927 TaxID=1423727 RepID=A0A0R2AZA3_9LACO|nr:hypothetical protein [Lacticaseibacillus brantae]KRM71874.1 hypothetical protein FC34_GL000850 [Lacticaseibacillus brantae DSM 23927]